MLALVIDHYRTSTGFNGLPVSTIEHDLGAPPEEVISALDLLIETGRITLTSERLDVNPFILRMPAAPVAAQLEILRSGEGGLMCTYPTPAELEGTIEQAERLAIPYTSRLKAGEAQLQPVFFEPVVLDRYMRDPRFWVDFSDYTGSISTKSEHSLDEAYPERDKISLQTFGIGYRASGLRVVAVFLRYLSDLTPEHQRIWQASEVSEECKIVGDYLRNAYEGEFSESISVYQALLLEQVAVNTLAAAAGFPPFFRETFEGARPTAYHPLLIPTLRAYLEFVAVLDKMLSENINLDFFPAQMRVPDRHGQRKGSISLLDEWVHTNWQSRGDDPIVAAPLRRIRGERQRPAHQIEADKYDITFYDQQRDLIRDAWSAVNALRQILATHPRARGIKLPYALEVPVAAY